LLGVLKRGKKSELKAEAKDQSAELSKVMGGSWKDFLFNPNKWVDDKVSSATQSVSDFTDNFIKNVSDRTIASEKAEKALKGGATLGATQDVRFTNLWTSVIAHITGPFRFTPTENRYKYLDRIKEKIEQINSTIETEDGTVLFMLPPPPHHQEMPERKLK
jgi:flagellar hook-basal body complex protein FliE